MDSEVTVELKNDISIRGTLKSVDQYLNIKLDDISVVDELKYPHLVRLSNQSFLRLPLCPFISPDRTIQKQTGQADTLVQSSVKNVFIRGSVVRYVHLAAASVDTALLEDATRRGQIPR